MKRFENNFKQIGCRFYNTCEFRKKDCRHKQRYGNCSHYLDFVDELKRGRLFTIYDVCEKKDDENVKRDVFRKITDAYEET